MRREVVKNASAVWYSWAGVQYEVFFSSKFEEPVSGEFMSLDVRSLFIPLLTRHAFEPVVASTSFAAFRTGSGRYMHAGVVILRELAMDCRRTNFALFSGPVARFAFRVLNSDSRWLFGGGSMLMRILPAPPTHQLCTPLVIGQEVIGASGFHELASIIMAAALPEAVESWESGSERALRLLLGKEGFFTGDEWCQNGLSARKITSNHIQPPNDPKS
ncbi:hypothetical protein FB451DRAFT_1370056 [Mycena latifolia]|nr:hypothetical protein FB451DRAFT_1370056 [Mycena latifolia]